MNKKSFPHLALLSIACVLFTPYAFGAESNKRLTSKLHTAVRKHKLDEVTSFLEQGANANKKEFSSGPTPLGQLFNQNIDSQQACKIAEELIDNGANVDGTFLEVGFPTTPLLKAAQQSFPGLTQVFLDHGANVHYSYNDAPLDAAIRQCMHAKRTGPQWKKEDANATLVMLLEAASPMGTMSLIKLNNLVKDRASRMYTEDVKAETLAIIEANTTNSDVAFWAEQAEQFATEPAQGPGYQKWGPSSKTDAFELVFGKLKEEDSTILLNDKETTATQTRFVPFSKVEVSIFNAYHNARTTTLEKGDTNEEAEKAGLIAAEKIIRQELA